MCDTKKNYAIITDQVDDDLQTACANIKAEGYTYVELHNVFGKSIEECDETETAKIKEILDEYNLQVVNIASTIFFLCPLYEHYRISLFNPAFHAFEGTVEEHLTKLHNACRIANTLQCKTIRIFPFRYPDNEDIEIVGTKKDQERIIDIFKKAVDIAKLYDVTLVIENCPYSHLPKGEMTDQVCKEINDEHLQLLWDPANSYRAEKHKVPKEYQKLTLSQEYQFIKNNIRHIHLKNYHYDETKTKPFLHAALFDGDIPYPSLLREVRKEYPYYYSLEPEVEYDETIRSMRAFKHYMEHDMKTGFAIHADVEQLEFNYGDNVYGPITEKRKLDDIRNSLSDPTVNGPEYVYAVAMDVAKKQHREDLIKRNLLYGAMIFGKGIVGEEPVRSQGHIHAVSPSCQASTCEVYEIWSGEAYIYMQETANDHPGKCYAIHAKAGDVVIVPPNWAHATINANPKEEMLFGAWCVRDYGFDYEDVRAHHGIAYFPKVRNDEIVFEANPAYQSDELIIKEARDYPEFNLEKGIPIYTQYEQHPDRFDFVANPALASDIWEHFEP